MRNKWGIGASTSLLVAGELASRDRLEQEAAALAPTVANPPALPPPPEGMPEPVEGWRNNFKLLEDAVAGSPLPTRQQKRAAARDLARGMAQVNVMQSRKDAKIAKRAARRAANAAG